MLGSVRSEDEDGQTSVNADTMKIYDIWHEPFAIRGDLSTPTFSCLWAFSRQAPCFGGVVPRPIQPLALTAMAKAAVAWPSTVDFAS